MDIDVNVDTMKASSDCSEKVMHFLYAAMSVDNSRSLASGQVTRCANYPRDGCHLNWINSRIFSPRAAKRGKAIDGECAGMERHRVTAVRPRRTSTSLLLIVSHWDTHIEREGEIPYT